MAELIGAVTALASVGIKLAEVIVKLRKSALEAVADLDIKGDIESLRKELEWMQSFLKDAEKKPGRNSHLFKTWVSEVSKLANECEDVADQILLLTLEESKTHRDCLNLKAMSSCCISSRTNLRNIQELSAKIKRLLSDSRDISSRRSRYDPNAEAGTTKGSKNVDEKLKELRRSAPYANNEHMVGLYETAEDLTSKLMNGASGSFVISILGMGGLGKTTLARKLYNSLADQYFESNAWVCISQEYNTLDILMSLITSMTTLSDTEHKLLTTISYTEAYLRKYLSGRRFLVVVDDVWEREAWESLERAFPDDDNGSKVIITTRNEEVASLNNAYVHRLRYLNKDESWELFCRKALPPGLECPSNLEQVGKEMVAKCSGLPLAIVILGGILCQKPRTFSKWRIVRDNLWKELKNSIHINAILTLSFQDLPDYLKPCFLYVSMFPEDFEISVSRLMLLWQAEEFIKPDEDGCTGDAAKSYFDELVGRSLFSKTDEDWIDSTFGVHDLLRDLAILKAGEIGFSLYYDGKGTISKALLPHRRLAILHGIPVGYTNDSLHTLCRSFMWNKSLPSLDSELLLTLHEKFRMLRVLDLEVRMHSTSSKETLKLPNAIGMLIHLRYLGFQNDFLDGPSVYELPETIGNLKALQTISIGNVRNIALPESVMKLTQLKHLIRDFTFSIDEIESSVCLETLEGIKGKKWCSLDTTKLFNLRSLKLTRVEEVREPNLERFYDNFKYLEKLHTLSVWGDEDKDPDISIEKIFERCPTISHLDARGISFHNSLGLDSIAVNLEVLEIRLSGEGICDIIGAIEKLPQLESLLLYYFTDNQSITEVICSEEGFAQLRTLIIAMSEHLVLSVKEGCMPLLERLEIVLDTMIDAPERVLQLVTKSQAISY